MANTIYTYSRPKNTGEGGNSGSGILGTYLQTTVVENAKEADKLTYIHNIWGQQFNGTLDVDGNLTANGDIHVNSFLDENLQRKGGNIYSKYIDSSSGLFYDIETSNLIANRIETTDMLTQYLVANLGAIDELSSVNIDAANADINSLIAQYLEANDIVTKNLTVTQQAHFFEVIIEKIKAAGGALILSPADGFVVQRVEHLGDTYKLYWPASDGKGKNSVNMWHPGDLAYCQTFNLGVGTSYNASNKFYWTLVTSSGTTQPDTDGISYHYIQIVKNNSGATRGNVNPEVGDNIAMLGSDNLDRQSAIYISAHNSIDTTLKAPLICHYKGICRDFNLSAHKHTWFAANGNTIKGKLYIENGSSVEDMLNNISSEGVVASPTETKQYYFVSNTNTTPNEENTTWLENIPSVNEGQYLHIKTETTWSNGQKTNSYTFVYYPITSSSDSVFTTYKLVFVLNVCRVIANTKSYQAAIQCELWKFENGQTPKKVKFNDPDDGNISVNFKLYMSDNSEYGNPITTIGYSTNNLLFNMSFVKVYANTTLPHPDKFILSIGTYDKQILYFHVDNRTLFSITDGLKLSVSLNTSTLESNTNRISILELDVSSFRVNISKIESDISTNTSSISELLITSNGLSSTVSNIQNTVNSHTTQISTISQTANSIQLLVNEIGLRLDNNVITLDGNTNVNGMVKINQTGTGLKLIDPNGGTFDIGANDIGNYTDFENKTITKGAKSNRTTIEFFIAGESMYPNEDGEIADRYETKNSAEYHNIGTVKKGQQINVKNLDLDIVGDANATLYGTITVLILEGPGKTLKAMQTIATNYETYYSYNGLQWSGNKEGLVSWVATDDNTYYLKIEYSVYGERPALEDNKDLNYADVDYSLYYTLSKDPIGQLTYNGFGYNFGGGKTAFINKDHMLFTISPYAGIKLSEAKNTTNLGGNGKAYSLTKLVPNEARYKDTGYGGSFTNGGKWIGMNDYYVRTLGNSNSVYGQIQMLTELDELIIVTHANQNLLLILPTPTLDLVGKTYKIRNISGYDNLYITNATVKTSGTNKILDIAGNTKCNETCSIKNTSGTINYSGCKKLYRNNFEFVCIPYLNEYVWMSMILS